MSTETMDKKPATATEKKISAADAAKRVKRPVTSVKKDRDGAVVTDDNNNPVLETKLVAVAADELLAWADYGSHVVVVTKDGRKLSSADEA